MWVSNNILGRKKQRYIYRTDFSEGYGKRAMMLKWGN